MFLHALWFILEISRRIVDRHHLETPFWRPRSASVRHKCIHDYIFSNRYVLLSRSFYLKDVILVSGAVTAHQFEVIIVISPPLGGVWVTAFTTKSVMCFHVQITIYIGSADVTARFVYVALLNKGNAAQAGRMRTVHARRKDSNPPRSMSGRLREIMMQCFIRLSTTACASHLNPGHRLRFAFRELPLIYCMYYIDSYAERLPSRHRLNSLAKVVGLALLCGKK